MDSSKNFSQDSPIAIKIPATCYALLYDFYLLPKKTVKAKQELLKKLNINSIKYNFSTWNKILTEWIGNIEKCFSNCLSTFGQSRFSKPDVKLFFHEAEIIRNKLPTEDEFSTILDHLDVAKDSPKLWATLTLEFDKEDENFWKESFKKWTDLVRKKKYFMRSFPELNKSLTSVEERLLEIPQYRLDENLICHVEEVIIEILNCRVCLKTPDTLVDIFKVTEGISIANKINECSNIEEIKFDDDLPKQICLDCVKVLDTAWMFKTICESSNRQLRDPKPEIIESIQIIEVSQQAETEDEQMEYDDQTEYAEEDVQQEFKYELITLESPLKSPVNSIRKVTRATIIQSPTSPNKSINFKSVKVDSQSSRIIEENIDNFNPEKRYACDICKKAFKAKIALDIHLRVHSNYRPYVCSTCGKSFKTCSAVNNHKLSHSKDKDFVCDAAECSYRTNTIANLRIHKRIHTNEKNYKCDACGYKFRTSSNLTKHVRNVHNQQKLHKCDSCEKEYFSKESLRKHNVTHSKVKNYHCSICHSEYGWYNGLQKHYKSHHPELKAPTESSFISRL